MDEVLSDALTEVTEVTWSLLWDILFHEGQVIFIYSLYVKLACSTFDSDT